MTPLNPSLDFLERCVLPPSHRARLGNRRAGARLGFCGRGRLGCREKSESPSIEQRVTRKDAQRKEGRHADVAV